MRLRKFIFPGLSLALLLAAALGRAQPTPSEYQLKAAFLFNFARFVDWPPEAFASDKAPFVFGILGDNPFGKILDQTVAGKQINNRPVVVQVFHTAAEAVHCQILFISDSEKKHFAEELKTLNGSTVLTVSESDRFVESGGMINFIKVDSRIRFQINNDAAKLAKLKISSKLLSLAATSPR